MIANLLVPELVIEVALPLEHLTLMTNRGQSRLSLSLPLRIHSSLLRSLVVTRDVRSELSLLRIGLVCEHGDASWPSLSNVILFL